MPLQLARRPVKRKNAVRIQVVSLPEITVILLARIPGWPVDRIQFRIVTPGEPRWSAAMCRLPSLPGLIPGLPLLRNCVESPDLFACRLIERYQHAIRAVLATSHSCEDQVACRKRG